MLVKSSDVAGAHDVELQELGEWTEEDVVRLHGMLLEESFEQIGNHRTGSKKRAEILSWFLGVKSERPFSVRVCCRIFGYNPEEIRKQALEIARKFSH